MDVTSTNAVVLEVLQRASSQNPEILKPAETKLKEWEIQPGFYSVLFNIITNHSIDLKVRWMAVLYFKNGVDKYWRKNSPNAISEQEKSTLRQVLVTNLHEPVNQIATQLAVLVSKVARIDCPKEWPELFPTLLQAIESNDRLIQHRSLLMLHHVVKSLSSKRLAGDRKLFQEFTENIYAFILNLWNNYTEVFLRDIINNAAAEVITENLEKALLSLRILRKLTVYGLKKPSDSQDAMCFLKIIFDRAKTTLENQLVKFGKLNLHSLFDGSRHIQIADNLQHKSHSSSDRIGLDTSSEIRGKQLRGKGIYLLELCEKFIIHLTKILLAVLENHPTSYIEFIQPTLEFTVYYIFTAQGAHYIYERFIIQCFNLIKGILLCIEYKPSKSVDSNKVTEIMKAHQIKMNFFQANVLSEMCQKLVTHYFLLTQDDLAMWDADPETFATDEGGESWKYSLRPSTETVFVTLFHEFRGILTPVLLDMIQSINCLASPDDLNQILHKDAVYNAVGLAAFDLYDEIDFNQWFSNTLNQELKIKTNNYRIIRRRVAWLIGNWTGIKLSSSLRPALYTMVLNLLESDEDMAVRLTASTTLRLSVDDFEFNREQFQPYLEPMFNSLFNLLKECCECDTKMHVLNVMSLIIERVGSVIKPHSEFLIQYLPLLWQDAEEHNMLRCAIVSTLVQLVKALSSVDDRLYPFLLPVIQLGTDINQEQIVYLLEDCLQLWLAVLENSVNMTNELMQLFNNMPQLLEYSSENLRYCLCIIQAHILLAPEQTLKMQVVPVIIVCDSILSDLRSEGIVMLLSIVETCIRASPSLAMETIKPILPRIFEAVYRGDNYPMVMSMYLSIVARVLLFSFDTFSEMLVQVAQMHGDTQKGVLDCILMVWITKMPCISQQDRKKLLGLALSNLLTTQSQSVLEKFSGIVINIVETLNDIMKTDDLGVLVDSLVLVEGIPPTFIQDDVDYETEHDNRKRHLMFSDPIHNIVLKDYFQIQVTKLKSQIDPINFDQLLLTLDHDIVFQLKEYITF